MFHRRFRGVKTERLRPPRAAGVLAASKSRFPFWIAPSFPQSEATNGSAAEFPGQLLVGKLNERGTPGGITIGQLTAEETIEK